MISSNFNALQYNNNFANQNAKNIASFNKDTNLNKEITDQITIKDINEINVKAIQAQDQMLGTLLDLKA